MKIPRSVVVAAAERVQQLPAPFLSELQGLRNAAFKRGKEITDLGAYSVEVQRPFFGQAEAGFGKREIKKIFCEYLSQEYHADIDPENECLLLPGGRASLLLLGAYFIEGSTVCYCPDPGFDAYRKTVLLFGGKLKLCPLYPRSDYLPNLDQFDSRETKLPRLLFVNSPHNPTGAVCDQNFYSRLERLAAERNILVIVDSSYALSFAGHFRAPLFSESARRLRVGLEIFSFSTNLCAPTLKLTALVGRRALIAPMKALAHSLGSIPPVSLLYEAASFFSSVDALRDSLSRCRKEMETRISVVVERLQNAGIEFYPVCGAGYVWVKIRRGRLSLSFVRGLLRRHGVLVAPGAAFGEEGEGWVRIAVNVGGDRLKEAIDGFVRFYQPIRSRLHRREL